MLPHTRHTGCTEYKAYKSLYIREEYEEEKSAREREKGRERDGDRNGKRYFRTERILAEIFSFSRYLPGVKLEIGKIVPGKKRGREWG